LNYLQLELSSAQSDSDKDYYYEQIGDGHFCFDKAKRQVQAKA